MCSIRFICALHKVHTCTSFQYQEYLCSVVEGVVGLGELVEGVVGLGELVEGVVGLGELVREHN